MFKNSNIQGNAGLGAAIEWFTSLGNTVLIPLTDSQEYDLVVDENSVLRKVQVKTTFCKRRNFEVDLRTNGGNKSGTGKTKYFDHNLVDYLFVLTADGDRYLINSECVLGRTSISLGKRYEKFKLTVVRPVWRRV